MGEGLGKAWFCNNKWPGWPWVLERALSAYMSGWNKLGDATMHDAFQVGWLMAIIIGGIAGWLAGKFMNMPSGLFMNIILGIVGAVVANAVLGVFGIVIFGGWLAYLIAGFIGACILLFVVKLIRS